jgi:hypothetical protein
LIVALIGDRQADSYGNSPCSSVSGDPYIDPERTAGDAGVRIG